METAPQNTKTDTNGLTKVVALHKILPAAFVIFAIWYAIQSVDKKMLEDREREAQVKEHVQKQKDKLLGREQ